VAVSAPVEVVEEVETAPMEVEAAETAPVTIMEAEPSSGAHRHSAQGTHSPRAPPGPAAEERASVEALDGGGTPEPARRSVQVSSWPHVVRQEKPGRCWAQLKAPGPGARQTASGPRVARPEAPSPPRVQQRAPEQRVVQEEAQAPRVAQLKALEQVVEQKDL
jgi:hypothetical protein